jgi:hypothetical protein
MDCALEPLRCTRFAPLRSAGDHKAQGKTSTNHSTPAPPALGRVAASPLNHRRTRRLPSFARDASDYPSWLRRPQAVERTMAAPLETPC